jgi:hypothetical protein
MGGAALGCWLVGAAWPSKRAKRPLSMVTLVTCGAGGVL